MWKKKLPSIYVRRYRKKGEVGLDAASTEATKRERERALYFTLVGPGPKERKNFTLLAKGFEA